LAGAYAETDECIDRGRSLIVVLLWTGRAAASFFLIFGALVFVTFIETGELWSLGISLAALGGALLFIVGLERPGNSFSSWARPIGWSMMAVASIVPASLVFISMALALLALPAVFVRPRHRIA
jgi:hypothetical protein